MADTDSTDWYSADAATFGDRTAAAREAAGLTQEQLARRLGVKLTTIQNWENDLSEPRAYKLQMMAGNLNVSMRWLLTGEGIGVDAPLEQEQSAGDMKDALIDLARLRAQALAMSKDIGQLEKRLRGLIREAT